MSSKLIHPTAIVHPNAKLADDVSVGAYSIIGEHVEIGAGSVVGSHVVIDGHTTIGKGNRFFQFSSIGEIPQDKKYKGEPTRLVIGDNNTIRECCTFNTGTMQDKGATTIGSGNWIMAYVHIAHDCQLGSHIIMANGASLAGHVEIGDYANVGAFSGVHQFTRLGAYCFIGAYTVINKDILPYMKSTADREVKVLGANRIGLERVGLAKSDIDELDEAYRILCRSKLNTTQALEAIENRHFASTHVRALVEFIRGSERGVAK